VQTRDPASARSRLTQAGYVVQQNAEGTLLLQEERAVTNPEHISKLLVYADMPPTLIQVEEEDLEHYFLRVIGSEGGVRP
jgi:ABC-2 type transport system ATP-binding protein